MSSIIAEAVPSRLGTKSVSAETTCLPRWTQACRTLSRRQLVEVGQVQRAGVAVADHLRGHARRVAGDDGGRVPPPESPLPIA